MDKKPQISRAIRQAQSTPRELMSVSAPACSLYVVIIMSIAFVSVSCSYQRGRASPFGRFLVSTFHNSSSRLRSWLSTEVALSSLARPNSHNENYHLSSVIGTPRIGAAYRMRVRIICRACINCACLLICARVGGHEAVKVTCRSLATFWGYTCDLHQGTDVLMAHIRSHSAA